MNVLRMDAIQAINETNDAGLLRQVLALLNHSSVPVSPFGKYDVTLEEPSTEELEQWVMEAEVAFEKGECLSAEEMKSEIGSFITLTSPSPGSTSR